MGFCQAQHNLKIAIPVRASRRTERSPDRPETIRVDVNLVSGPVAVRDPYKHAVRGLQKSDFRIFEDGVQREISYFFSDDSPITVGIVFDASRSMAHKMEKSRQAVTEFLRISMPGDEFFLLKCSDQPKNISEFTTNVEHIENSLQALHPDGWTFIYDAIYLSMHHIKRAKIARKVLLVLCYEGDNNRRLTEREIK